MNKNKSGFRYVYSVYYASKLMKLGCVCLDTGCNVNTGHFWWKFNYEDAECIGKLKLNYEVD